MSQWLDMLATNSVGATNTADTSGVGWSNDSGTLKGAVQTPIVKNNDNTMLYLTGAGVLLAALALYKRR